MRRMRRPLLLLGHRMLRLQSKGLEAQTGIGRMYVGCTYLVMELTDITGKEEQMSRENGINLEGTREDRGLFDILFNNGGRIMQYHSN